jgi:hypothetical protein
MDRSRCADHGTRTTRRGPPSRPSPAKGPPSRLPTRPSPKRVRGDDHRREMAAIPEYRYELRVLRPSRRVRLAADAATVKRLGQTMRWIGELRTRVGLQANKSARVADRWPGRSQRRPGRSPPCESPYQGASRSAKVECLEACPTLIFATYCVEHLRKPPPSLTVPTAFAEAERC